MRRFTSEELDKWLDDTGRKPLVIRGARQVGKTWLARDLAERRGLRLVELNFERLPGLADLFSSNKPQEIVRNIGAETGLKIELEESLLFLDEIQAAPEVFSTLRWFREDMPELPIVAAGSLLDFALGDARFSMPVGRLTYFYIEPLSFLEFVLACGNEPLFETLSSFSMGEDIPETLHGKCLDMCRDYFLAGGMPESVVSWREKKDPGSCMKIQQDLIATFRDDFHKYGAKFDPLLLDRLLASSSEQLGGKFVYSRVDPEKKVGPVKEALERLFQARLCAKVAHTAGNGLPLGAQSNEKFFKVLLLDVGLVSAQLGLASIKPSEAKKVVFANKGGLAEQLAGQLLRASRGPLADPRLFYWQRIGGRLGEIDYIVQHGTRVVPVEVKSGATGRMKSLHQFMAEKGLDFAVRLHTGRPRMETVDVKTTLGAPVQYRLLSVPIYLAERLDRLVEQASSL